MKQKNELVRCYVTDIASGHEMVGCAGVNTEQLFDNLDATKR